MAASQSLPLTPFSCQSVNTGLHHHIISARRYTPNERYTASCSSTQPLPCEVFDGLLPRSIHPLILLALPSTSQDPRRGIRPCSLRLLDFPGDGAAVLPDLRVFKSSLSLLFALDAKPLRPKPFNAAVPLVQTLDSPNKPPEHLQSVQMLSERATKLDQLISCLRKASCNKFITGRLAQLVRAWC
ncbi:hypothetical protein BKA80DRAFT_281261 [Phyllosticta citrichinensis]